MQHRDKAIKLHEMRNKSRLSIGNGSAWGMSSYQESRASIEKFQSLKAIAKRNLMGNKDNQHNSNLDIEGII